MKQKLYLECYAGISGDMTVAALLDLGADADKLKRTLDSLKLEGYTIRISRVKKSGLDACDFAVNLDAEHENHDHDMAYLHGDGTAAAAEGHVHGHSHEEHGHEHGHSHEEHGHEHGHSHEGHSHEHGHSHEEHSHSHEAGHHHGHSHRGLPEILEILRGSEMTDRAKEIAERIFRSWPRRRQRRMVCRWSRCIFMRWERWIPSWMWRRQPSAWMTWGLKK